MSRQKEERYMDTGAQLRSATDDYVKAARDMDLDDDKIVRDFEDALHEAGIKNVTFRIG